MRQTLAARMGRWLVVLAAPVFFLALIAEFYLIHRFLNSPTKPNQATGQIVEWNNHGVFRYITANQQALHAELLWVLGCTFVISCIGILLVKGTRAFEKHSA